MMGDPYKKVRSGERLAIPAMVWNRLIDFAKGKGQGLDGEAIADLERQTGIVAVLNSSGSDLEHGDILGLDDPIITYADDAEEFKRRARFEGSAPGTGHEGKFAVLIEPADDGEIARAVVSGVAVCQVKFLTTANLKFADVEAGTTDYLLAGSSGAAQILWRSGSGASTDWCIVRIGNPAGGGDGSFPVLVEKDGGANGTATTPASYTYTVRDLDGNVLDTTVPYARPRAMKGPMTFQVGADGVGLAAYDAAGDLMLLDAYEQCACDFIEMPSELTAECDDSGAFVISVTGTRFVLALPEEGT